ncbi:MAG: hypothetical protein GY899_18420 [Verrucomicrobiaceae bacterium]|nr:hypothetical protein [Verrucomicrobiaceae bacterium]
MQPTIICSVLIMLVTLAGGLRAQEQALTPSETNLLLDAVKDLKGKVKDQRYGIHASAIQSFRAASSSTTSAYDFYLKCYKEMNFTRKGARESEYLEWKKKNRDYLRSKEHSEARRMQLQFLVLTLRAAQFTKKEQYYSIIPELTTLVDNALSAYPHLGSSRKILHSDAVGSTFGRVYDLGSTMKRNKNWARSPMDIDGIYDRTILPLYRSKEKISELSAAWDKRISQRITMVGSLGSSESEAKFVRDTLPRMKWEKNMDLLRGGKRRTALTAMVSIVRSNAEHENIDQWIDRLEGYLSGEEDPGSFEDLESDEDVAGEVNLPQSTSINSEPNIGGGRVPGNRREAREAIDNLDLNNLRKLLGR